MLGARILVLIGQGRYVDVLRERGGDMEMLGHHSTLSHPEKCKWWS